MQPLKEIEIIALAENNQAILDALEAKDIQTISVKDTEATTRTKPNKSKSKEPCCGQSKKSPSMMKKVANFASTTKKWIKAGMPVVDIRELIKRLDICSSCDSLKEYTCMECGCPMDRKAKMDIDKLCELNKW